MQRRCAFLRTWTRSVHAEPVLDVFVVEIEDDHGENVPDPEIGPYGFPCSGFLKHAAKRYFREGCGFPFLEKNQHTVVRVLRENREIDAARHQVCAEWIGATRTKLEAFVLVGRVDVNAVHFSYPPSAATPSSTVAWMTKNFRNPVTDMVSRIPSTTPDSTILPPLPVTWRYRD